ncbi:TRAP transporter large permease [Lentibacillus jeotgali]|uniref:TRAP transporter large permease n=1 Tax=Lentibacillus jeotgali TaxID=558169 RepID=UPI00026283EA|nr:TRAP transporter large permease [Lentibacillus jeotgali]
MLDITFIGIICILLLLIFIAIGVPVGISFITSGLISTFLILDGARAIALLVGSAHSSIAAPSWVAIPLFILLGALAVQSGLATKAFRSADAVASGIPGSVGIATCLATAGFGAISGASIAATSIFGKMALPEMRKLGYNKSFSSGIIASAGTFASMIPPSMMFIIYALFTQTSVAGLFFAGIIPGLLSAVIYSIYIYIRCKNDPAMMKRQKAQPELTVKQRFSAMGESWPIILVAVALLGGIYTGIFTPTESAAVGCILIVVIGFIQGHFRKFDAFSGALRDSANTTSMVFLINIGALFYAKVLALSQMPANLTSYFVNLDVPPIVIIIIISLIFFLLGMIMVPIGIYALILPIVAPIVSGLGYDLIWFGVIALKLTEIGAVTPPVGLNVYALKGVVSRDITITDIFKGVTPFVIIDIFVLIVLIAFPILSLWLPNLLF